ncbi:MAG: type I-G CRISPR-associated RAMP protein Csb1/Cas7g [Gammaproteobacteria bacterium]
MTKKLTLDDLKQAIAGNAAALRCVTSYQPVGGAGDKVFPPTYEGGQYATEERVIDGERIPCVLLDSVQSQANRMELALLEALRSKRIELPLLSTKFDDQSLAKKFTVTSLDAPHRVADAIFRDSLLGGVMFRESERGKVLDAADIRNATGLFGLCPTALVFGLWDSTGPRGGLGAKFQRAIVSEIVGHDAAVGVRSSSRIDPAGIRKRAGPLFRVETGSWTLDQNDAVKSKGKPALFGRTKKGELVAFDPNKDQDEGKPSKANHGNVTPSLKDSKTNQLLPGGFTISKAVQTTVLSLAALRRLRFPANGSVESNADRDCTARTALAAMGLAAATLTRADGDLRSRCHLFPEEQPVWQLLDIPGAEPRRFELAPDDSIELLKATVEEAKSANLPWEGEIELNPSDELVELVRRSQELASAEWAEAD